MITILNRELLLVTRDLQDFWNAKRALEDAAIEFTTKYTTMAARRYTPRYSALTFSPSHDLGTASMYVDGTQEYAIYVKRAEIAKARAALREAGC